MNNKFYTYSRTGITAHFDKRRAPRGAVQGEQFVMRMRIGTMSYTPVVWPKHGPKAAKGANAKSLLSVP